MYCHYGLTIFIKLKMKLNKVRIFLLNLFFISINFEIWDPLNTGGIFSISKLFGYLFFSSILTDLGYFLKIKKIYSKYIVPLLLFFGYLTFVNIINLNFTSYYFFSASIFQNIILFIILLNFEYRYPGSLLKAFLFFAYGSLILSVLYFFGIGVEIAEFGGRTTMFGDNENNVGIRMAISTIIFWRFFNQSEFSNFLKTILYLFPIPFLLILLIDTGSRVSLISVSLALMFSFLFIKKKYLTSKLLFIICGVILLFYGINFVFESDVMGSRIQKTIDDGTLAGRDEIWKRVTPFILDNLIFGVGNSGYSYFSFKEFGNLKAIHNVFIEVLVYTGIIGFSLYSYFFMKIIKNSYRVYKKMNEILPILLLIPILGLMLSAQLLNVKTGWIIFAYIASQSKTF